MKKTKIAALLLTACMMLSLISPAIAIEEDMAAGGETSTAAPEPAKSSGESEAPTAEPPAEQPEAPAAEPPAGQPEAPAAEPPLERPEAPATESPSAQPEAPAAEPPAGQPKAPATESPSGQPEAPAAEPPLERPEAPVSEIPVEKPEALDFSAMTAEELSEYAQSLADEDELAVFFHQLSEEQIDALILYRYRAEPDAEFGQMTAQEIYEYSRTLASMQDTDAFFARLTGEQMVAFRHYLEELDHAPAQPDQVIRTESSAENLAANDTDVGPLLMPPVEPEQAQPLLQKGAGAMFFAMRVTVLDNDHAGNDLLAGKEGLELTKSINAEQNMLTLEAYVTGHLVTTGGKPADIILVLDQSGSMSYDFATVTEQIQCARNDAAYNAYINGKEPYVMVDGNQQPVTVARRQNSSWGFRYYSYTYRYFDSNSGWQELTRNYDSEAPPISVYYDTIRESEIRLHSLMHAVNTFVDAVHQEAEEMNMDYRIALAGFSNATYHNTELLTGTRVNRESAKKDRNPSYYPYNSAYNGAQYQSREYDNALSGALQEMNTASGYRNVKDAVGYLTAHGGTMTQDGMAIARDILEANPVTGEPRNRIVVVFTDGQPGETSFDNNIANQAIQISGEIKRPTGSGGYGATVYSIGIFDGADPGAYTSGSDVNARTNRFMHYLSSNYPNATSLSNGGSGSQNNNYYMSANNPEALNIIFNNIFMRVQTGESNLDLDSSTILRDVLSDYVQLPAGTSPSQIEVSTADYLGDEQGIPTWGEEQPYPHAKVTIDKDTINVSGFDYSDEENAVLMNDRTPQGKKLIVRVPVEASDDTFGGNQVPTNNRPGELAGIYYGGELMEPFHEVPRIDIPIRYEMAANSQTVYLGNEADLSTILQYVDGYLPNGKNNAYVNIVYTLKRDGQTVAEYDIPAGVAPGNMDWASSVLADCTGYTLECFVSPVYRNGAAQSWSRSAGATVHVLKPSLTVRTNDVWADWNEEVDLSQWAIGGVDFTEAYQPELTGWTEAREDTDYPEPTGEAPTIEDFSTFQYTFAPSGAGDAAQRSGTIYATGEKDTDFSVTLAGFSIRDTAFTNGQQGSTATVAVQYPQGRENLTVHTNRFHVEITKKENAPSAYGPQAFQFVMTDEGSLKVPFTLARGMDIPQTKTIQGMLCGQKTYQITEDSSWAWRYKTDHNKTIKAPVHEISRTEPKRETIKVTFVNEFLKDKWLSNSDGKSNIFGAVS